MIECTLTNCKSYDETKPNYHYCQCGIDNPYTCKVYCHVKRYSWKRPLTDEDIEWINSMLNRNLYINQI